ncbi:MAG TPA: DUF3131 domain-containing protein, partial [Anaerolineales bacterium]
MRNTTRTTFLAILSVMLLLAVALPAQAHPTGLDVGQRRALDQYAHDTWQSFVAMTDPDNGLPADNVSAEGVRAGYTSPTNIGLYVWSTLAARDLQIIKPAEARLRIGKVLDMLETMERHTFTGQYYNWYDPSTGEKLTVWPPSGDPVYPFLSSVDNGWLASALIMITNAVPQLRDRAQAILDSMDFGCYYDPNARGPDLGAG